MKYKTKQYNTKNNHTKKNKNLINKKHKTKQENKSKQTRCNQKRLNLTPTLEEIPLACFQYICLLSSGMSFMPRYVLTTSTFRGRKDTPQDNREMQRKHARGALSSMSGVREVHFTQNNTTQHNTRRHYKNTNQTHCHTKQNKTIKKNTIHNTTQNRTTQHTITPHTFWFPFSLYFIYLHFLRTFFS